MDAMQALLGICADPFAGEQQVEEAQLGLALQALQAFAGGDRASLLRLAAEIPVGAGSSSNLARAYLLRDLAGEAARRLSTPGQRRQVELDSHGHRVLGVLQGGARTSTQLSAELQLSLSEISRLTHQLAQSELVSSERGGRNVWWMLSPAGHTQLDLLGQPGSG